MIKDFYKQTAPKMPKLFLGYFLCALGITMMYNARSLGLGPWDVLHTGVMNHTPLTFGQTSQLTGLVLVILSYFLGILAGIGTVLNVIIVGIIIDLINKSSLIFTPETFIGQLVLLEAGVWVLSLGIYFYLKPGLGAGPRDGLMIGLVKKLNLPVSVVKTAIEITAVIAGAMLGGSVGVGTVVVALTQGYAIQTVFKLGKYDTKIASHRSFKDEILLLKNKRYM
ncbi:membrane protein [Proteinivorax hydrogeniformans]|uniref:Membrane protein n=1 Tax=Proteinivorax hydrogeniformans TaxID=1826727 RepID=A0AAU8HSC3_9FIRM